MKYLWSDKVAKKCKDELGLRVYTSRLLGCDNSLVLHGGGNTSVKIDDTIYVKGSGWDLSTIEKEGFSPVKLQALLDMAKKEHLSDTEMVKLQKEAMSDKTAPNPSVEAILHAIIPYKFVDHTHANSIVTISNSVSGKKIINELYKDYLIVDYVMPGFILAKKVYKLTSKGFDWEKCKGIILHHHGIFTFGDSAKKSYDDMIKSVQIAEDYLENYKLNISKLNTTKKYDIDKLKELIDKAKGYKTVFKINRSNLAIFYSNQPNLKEFASRGVLTPEHIIRTKRVPLVIEDDDFKGAIEKYIEDYKAYFKKYAKDQTMLNPTPNYIVLKGYGVISIGKTQKEADIINDIINATMEAVLKADKLGGYLSINEKESFDMEYWELEQNKLKRQKAK